MKLNWLMALKKQNKQQVSSAIFDIKHSKDYGYVEISI